MLLYNDGLGQTTNEMGENKKVRAFIIDENKYE
jgi:hypothetical protein